MATGIEREALIELGMRYLDEAELAEPAREFPGAEE